MARFLKISTALFKWRHLIHNGNTVSLISINSLWENIFHFSVGTVPADYPAPWGAWTSATAARTKVRSCLYTASVLTHLPLDKMATILADNNFKCIFLNENDRILIQIWLKFVPRNPADNNPALVYVMAWRRRGDKPLSEPVLTQFTDAYMRH